MTDLLVSYPAGSIAESTSVAAVTRAQNRVLFAVGLTPCHPESPRWPDQPSDRSMLKLEGVELAVECHEGALLGSELRLSDLLDDPDHVASFGIRAHSSPPQQPIPCVVHSAPAEVEIAVGDKVSLHVDERYRRAVSRSHSRCHLVSLALNASLAQAWRKDPPTHDSLGSPDFDKLAIVSSKIDEQGSLDVYRVGKHVRKSGFSAEILNDADALAERVSTLAKGWLRSSPEISVTPGKCRLQERRTWSCRLPQGNASFPCGGTHPSHIEPDEGLSVAIAWYPEERRLEMRAEGSLFHL
jgi:alanyl-tRNA synthetase